MGYAMLKRHMGRYNVKPEPVKEAKKPVKRLKKKVTSNV